MKQIVILSGKGGTGKTSVAGGFIALSKKCVSADCDVDAANLNLLFSSRQISKSIFSGGKKAKIKSGHCTACGKCEEICRFGAIKYDGPGNGRVEKTFTVDEVACEGCGICHRFCAEGAIEFLPADCGDIYLSDTEYGPQFHARLNPGEGNSGKMVSDIRDRAMALAEERKYELLILDGSPGIGCPVIASITGVDIVVLVTEPTLSGFHDLKRVFELTRQLGPKSGVIINKADINSSISTQIENWCESENCSILGRIPYMDEFFEAQKKGKTVIEDNVNSEASKILKTIWEKLTKIVGI